MLVNLKISNSIFANVGLPNLTPKKGYAKDYLFTLISFFYFNGMHINFLISVFLFLYIYNGYVDFDMGNGQFNLLWERKV